MDVHNALRAPAPRAATLLAQDLVVLGDLLRTLAFSLDVSRPQSQSVRHAGDAVRRELDGERFTEELRGKMLTRAIKMTGSSSISQSFRELDAALVARLSLVDFPTAHYHGAALLRDPSGSQFVLAAERAYQALVTLPSCAAVGTR